MSARILYQLDVLWNLWNSLQLHTYSAWQLIPMTTKHNGVNNQNNLNQSHCTAIIWRQIEETATVTSIIIWRHMSNVSQGPTSGSMVSWTYVSNISGQTSLINIGLAFLALQKQVIRPWVLSRPWYTLIFVIISSSFWSWSCYFLKNHPHTMNSPPSPV